MEKNYYIITETTYERKLFVEVKREQPLFFNDNGELSTRTWMFKEEDLEKAQEKLRELSDEAISEMEKINPNVVCVCDHYYENEISKYYPLDKEEDNYIELAFQLVTYDEE